MASVKTQFEDHTFNDTITGTPTTTRTTTDSASQTPTPANVDKVVQSVTNATKRLSQISTITNNSNKKRKSQNKIGPWKLGRTLGRGSTGRVRLAKNINTGKLAAVKIVPKSNFKKLENPKYKRNQDDQDSGLPYGIEREIIIMKLISHPNIMGLYDVWENKNDLYLILEYIEGGELFDYLIKRGKLQEFEAINYFKQIINGINYLHQFNICHRDLKPENLLLDFNKNIKIADFGMAALEIKEKLLETSCGSPHYASPEIVAGKNYHGAPSDIWSCGIILFALLTGHLPFDDENIRKLLLKVQSGKFNMPHDLSWEAKDLISKMLKVNPKDRISIEDILLHPLLTKYPDPPTPSSVTGTTLDLKNMNINPIESIDKIDQEILKNLSTLFHNCNEQTIISRLMSPNKCSEKMFYYLLMKYRNEHLSTSSSMDISDEATDVGSARNSLPRSTSVIKTTVVDDATGEVQTHTMVKKVENSTSIYSNKSLLNKKTLLDNVNHKQHPASNSVNKKKVVHNNQVIYSKSRNASSRSLRSNKSTSSTKNSQPSPSSSESGGRVSTPMVKLPMQSPPNVPLPTTPVRGPNKQIIKPTTIETTIRTQNDKDSMRRRLTGTFGNKSLLNFELICEEVFSGDDNKENMTPALSTKTATPPPKKQAANYKERESSLARRERELAERVRSQNEAREQRLKQAEETERKLQAQQEKRRSLASIAEEQLVEKQRAVFNRLLNRQSTNDFANLVGDRRSVTEPPVHSLDPKVSSLLRARTLATPVPRKFEATGSESPTKKVLNKLGIELDVTESPASNRFKKTGSSRNLTGILKPRDSNLPSRVPSKGSLLKVSTSRNLAGYLKSEANEEEPDEIANIKMTEHSNLSQTSFYKSLDDKRKSSTVPIVEEEGEEEDVISYSQIPETSLPNPRFSTFSFGGLLLSKPQTATNEEGDLTIMQNTLSSGGTVVRRSIYKNSSIRKSSTILGLGIKVRDQEQPEQQQQQSQINQKQVNVSSSSEESKNTRRYSNDDADDELLSDSSTVDTEFSIEESASKQPPPQVIPRFDSGHSIVNSKETLILKKHDSDTGMHEDTTIRLYESYEDLTDKNSSFVAANTTGFDRNFSVPEVTGIIDESVVDDTAFNDNESGLLNARLSTGIFSTSGIPRSPRVELSERYVQEEEEEDDDYVDDEEEDCDDDNELEPVNTFQQREEKRMSVQAEESSKQTKRVSISEKKEFISSTSLQQYDTIVPTTSPGVMIREESPSRVPRYKRMSLYPKRAAPKPPVSEETTTKSNRFSWISVNTEEKTKSNWFKRFFQSLTGGSKKIESTPKHAPKDIEVVDSSLSSDELMQVIKNQLELKKLEGSISTVTIDEEFGMISGVIPAKYSSGRKLKFTIEVITFAQSSSLHIIKIKGNDKGFQNFVNIVTFVIRQEEFMNRKRMSSRGTTATRTSGRSAANNRNLITVRE
ncbi:uncharacterized protein SPAPADRAFT_50820 [Spathaspora passalidarum NRRL Y-27907]|uniref:non-specific serine/threonine protein kinase n=1 Tax=Spathaspora passalidarum (strain NRRL Y-27907 / 11-Y1) TaxID=619300 RepID=G3APT1_SPAPN|nr:uncharacterized protein SPAPADRAFT_50820 [Spathaspora passalidarum NRRL Y-27907]EGW32252.1 hypothetical protein SPAPADRAFT_50820 [Spathaspora passalidarum NRRL Y-27907]